MDLRPYNCLFTSCAFTRESFPDRQIWSEHLELEHGFGPTWDAIRCPLCLDTTKCGKSRVLIHFARHMEDIALASLPRDLESDPETESDTSADATTSRGSAASINEELESGILPVNPALKPWFDTETSDAGDSQLQVSSLDEVKEIRASETQSYLESQKPPSHGNIGLIATEHLKQQEKSRKQQLRQMEHITKRRERSEARARDVYSPILSHLQPSEALVDVTNTRVFGSESRTTNASTSSPAYFQDAAEARRLRVGPILEVGVSDYGDYFGTADDQVHPSAKTDSDADDDWRRRTWHPGTYNQLNTNSTSTHETAPYLPPPTLPSMLLSQCKEDVAHDKISKSTLQAIEEISQAATAMNRYNSETARWQLHASLPPSIPPASSRSLASLASDGSIPKNHNQSSISRTIAPEDALLEYSIETEGSGFDQYPNMNREHPEPFKVGPGSDLRKAAQEAPSQIANLSNFGPAVSVGPANDSRKTETLDNVRTYSTLSLPGHRNGDHDTQDWTSEQRMGRKTLQQSTQTYDKLLLSKLGHQNTPTRTAPEISSPPPLYTYSHDRSIHYEHSGYNHGVINVGVRKSARCDLNLHDHDPIQRQSLSARQQDGAALLPPRETSSRLPYTAASSDTEETIVCLEDVIVPESAVPIGYRETTLGSPDRVCNTSNVLDPAGDARSDAKLASPRIIQSYLSTYSEYLHAPLHNQSSFSSLERYDQAYSLNVGVCQHDEPPSGVSSQQAYGWFAPFSPDAPVLDAEKQAGDSYKVRRQSKSPCGIDPLLQPPELLERPISESFRSRLSLQNEDPVKRLLQVNEEPWCSSNSKTWSSAPTELRRHTEHPPPPEPKEALSKPGKDEMDQIHFDFIVVTQPTEFKSKKNLTKVRKKAMRAYLDPYENRPR